MTRLAYDELEKQLQRYKEHVVELKDRNDHLTLVALTLKEALEEALNRDAQLFLCKARVALAIAEKSRLK